MDVMRTFTEVTTDYRRLLDTIVERVGTHVQHHAAIRLVSPERDELELVASFDPDPQLRSLGDRLTGTGRMRVDAPHPTTGALQSGAPVLFRDVRLEELREDVLPESRQIMAELQVQSFLCVPLRIHREVIGVLSIVRRGRDAVPFDDADVELAQALADHAALAITNARLLEHSRRQLAERRRAEDALRMMEDARRYTQAIVDTVRSPILVLDPQLHVRSANRSFYGLYGLEPEQIRDRPLLTLPGWDSPTLIGLLALVLPRKREVVDFELVQDLPGLGHRTMLVHARALQRTATDADAIVLVVEDASERRAAERSEADPRPAAVPAPHDALRILLVDGDEHRAAQTLHILRQHRIANDVVRARDLDEATDVLRRPAGLVLLALEPIELSLELLRRRRHEALGIGVPFVVLAPRAGHPTLAEAQRLGANAVAVEPLGFEALARSVHALGLRWLCMPAA